MRHLLTYTSGIDGDVFTDTGRATNAWSATSACWPRSPSLFTPGAMYSYRNSGYALLGRIIEVLDRVRTELARRRALVRPASGMSPTARPTLYPEGPDPTPRG